MESELHATLIKAAVKKVFMQTGPDGKSRKVTYTGHVVGWLRQLVNAARLGRFFYSDWTQELLYTFIKVPMAMGLENSRPVGQNLQPESDCTGTTKKRDVPSY